MKTCHSLVAAAVCAGISGGAQGATVFQDAFETHSIGDQITAQVPPVGEWGSAITVTPSGHTVQANPLGGGQVLRTERGTSNPGYVNARSLTAPEANKVVTVSWDAFRVDAGSGAAVQPLYMGTSFFGDSTVDQNLGTQEIRYKDGSSTVGTGVLSGYGGWERYEMVITWGPDEGGGLIHPTFDLFFERLDASNSQGILAKTQLADDVAMYASGFTSGVGHMRWLYGMNAHFNSTPEEPVTATVYFDNVSITVTDVPEPASLMLLGSGGALMFVRRRHHGA